MKVKKTLNNKKTCQYCQNNNYRNKYSEHLKSLHQKELKVRQMVKKLNSLQLEEVKKLIVEFNNSTKNIKNES
jgi:hypothetical protein